MSVSEKSRRHYAALEAQKFGYGGKAYIIRLLDINHRTLNKGIKELSSSDNSASFHLEKQRVVGGGRKKNGAKSESSRAVTRFDRPS